MPDTRAGADARPDEVKPYSIASLNVLQMRKYRTPEAVAVFNATIEKDGQLVPAILAEIGGELWLADGAARFEALKACGKAEILAWIDPRIDTMAKLVSLIFKSESRSARHFMDLAELVHQFRVASGLSGKQTAAELDLPEGKVSVLLSFAEADYPEGLKACFADDRLKLQHHIAAQKLKPEDRVEALRAAAENGVSASKLAAKKKQKRNVQPTMLTIEVGGVSLTFPAAMAADVFRQHLQAVIGRVKESLKVVSKQTLPMREVLAANPGGRRD